MQRQKTLKVLDIERLENTSALGTLQGLALECCCSISSEQHCCVDLPAVITTGTIYGLG